jgi:hypothetical protein
MEARGQSRRQKRNRLYFSQHLSMRDIIGYYHRDDFGPAFRPPLLIVNASEGVRRFQSRVKPCWIGAIALFSSMSARSQSFWVKFANMS